MKKKVIFTAISLIYVIILFIGGSIARLDSGALQGSDKVLHFVGFFILTILLYLTFKNYKLKSPLIISFIIAFLIGIIIELIQLGIPSRAFSFLDLLADVIGIVFASVISWKFIKQ